MILEDAMRQESRQLELPLEYRGETPTVERSGEASTADCGDERSGNGDACLMERVVARNNVVLALKRVQSNKGSPGTDGMTVEKLREYLRETWPMLREQLLAGTYRPRLVKRQLIPKSDGGMRELGIPTALDRFIQQAILQVLQPRIDPSFSPHSHGFRPGRRAHDAVCEAQRYIQEGRRWVIDVDLEKFFDRVNHDVLMGKLAARIADKRLLGLIRRYLGAGIMRSWRAGVRVMQALVRLYAKLRLRINESKSAVTRVWDRKFLGYSFWVAKGHEVKRRVASKALMAMKRRVRELTARSCGRSLSTVVAELRGYLLGWKAYFRRADTPGVFREIDEWIRHRLRAIQLKQWKRGTTVYCELRARGIGDDAASRVAAHARRWWATSGLGLHLALPASHFDALGLPRLSA